MTNSTRATLTAFSLGILAVMLANCGASATVTLSSFPTFVFSSSQLTAGTTVHEAYLDGTTATALYTLDVASGASGRALVSSTGAPPTLVAGKIYVFAFYIETGSRATPTPLPPVTSTPVPSPTTAPVAGDIAIPSTLTGSALGQYTVTDPAFFNGSFSSIRPATE